jgi:hypothetical protein
MPSSKEHGSKSWRSRAFTSTSINDAADGPWWVLWVFLGWGLGVLAHAFGVYGHASKSIAQWEERKIEQLIEEK